jgi:hypothetical protein
VFLKFRRWLNVESRKADHARIYVSTDGSTWGDPVWENPPYDLEDDQWTQVVIDITDIAADEPTVYIKFTMGPTNSTRPFSGWNIDDLEVTSESIYPVEGTIGTQISIPGAGFGMKKGKVLIGSAALNVLSWTDELIVGTVSKVMLPGVYDLAIQPKIGIPIPPYRDYFSVKRPEIDLITPTSGSNPDQVTIKGRFFGSKKGKVYLEYDSKGVIKLKSCKVLSWNMDSKFSDGEVVFVVPKGLPPGTHPLKLVNSVGEALADFTILSP